MKTQLTTLLLFFPAISFCQKIYVEPLQNGYEKPIVEYLKQARFELADSTHATHRIECILIPEGDGNFVGYLRLIETRINLELGRSKEIRKKINPGSEPGDLIIKELSKKLLPKLLKDIKD